jgi:hypothetical protein
MPPQNKEICNDIKGKKRKGMKMLDMQQIQITSCD